MPILENRFVGAPRQREGVSPMGLAPRSVESNYPRKSNRL